MDMERFGKLERFIPRLGPWAQQAPNMIETKTNDETRPKKYQSLTRSEHRGTQFKTNAILMQLGNGTHTSSHQLLVNIT